jgi:hypothetical protein
MVAKLVEQVLLTAFPDGGQRTARRNALAAADAHRAARRDRVHAYAVLAGHPCVRSRTASATSRTANPLRKVASD